MSNHFCFSRSEGALSKLLSCSYSILRLGAYNDWYASNTNTKRWNTIENTKIKGLWERGSVVFLCLSCGLMALLCAYTVQQKASTGLRPSQLFRAINAANGAKPGSISTVDVKHERSGPIVNVAIFSSDGRKYAVSVEGTTGKVLSVARSEDEIVKTNASHRTG
ncbi:MAG: hypothetical protein EOP04_30085 [Proteobacteria bacterium]|nr:MAG: hypothetical protein EOP04_30085 [Pseudomonadota bacterium]